MSYLQNIGSLLESFILCEIVTKVARSNKTLTKKNKRTNRDRCYDHVQSKIIFRNALLHSYLTEKSEVKPPFGKFVALLLEKFVSFHWLLSGNKKYILWRCPQNGTLCDEPLRRCYNLCQWYRYTKTLHIWRNKSLSFHNQNFSKEKVGHKFVRIFSQWFIF